MNMKLDPNGVDLTKTGRGPVLCGKLSVLREKISRETGKLSPAGGRDESRTRDFCMLQLMNGGEAPVQAGRHPRRAISLSCFLRAWMDNAL